MTESKLNEIHDHWVKNSTPMRYANKLERSEFLLKYVEKYVEKKGKVLEVGCNVGRNLNHLYEHGYKGMTGIEISQEAAISLQKTYPKLAEDAVIINSPVEDVIKKFLPNSFNLVFSMAVFEHIHPDSEWVFEEIARITGSYLITVEAEETSRWHIFARNYKTIFENFGFKQVTESNCKEAGLGLYTLRVFKKVGN
ncbi:class I SAM-dependent methyltransferase [Oceanobacillus sp. FSL K6-2867]|uniref:class I SAM-dependent methyltransferase n=1 Tax=Oceanobacillus sp. FSL K6-2867 TaxID=2954748 RepID=UPI0030DA4FA4